MRKISSLSDRLSQPSMFEEIVGSSDAICRVTAQMMRVAPSDATVLITGESGTGKELIARAIHRNVAQIPVSFHQDELRCDSPSLIAAELFGYEKGAFTDANQRHAGRFEVANHGTLFLDEIGEMPSETQVALVARASGTRVRAGWRNAKHSGRRACYRGYQLRSAIGSCVREISTGSLLSAEYLSNPCPAASRAS